MDNDNILAVNNKKLENADFLQFYKAVRKKWAKPSFIVVIICVSLIYVDAIVEILLNLRRMSGSHLIFMTFLLILSIYIYAIFPTQISNLRYKQYLMTRNDKSKIVYYNDYLARMIGEEIVQTLSFKDAKRTILTDDLYIIEFPNKVYSIARRDGFSAGCLEAIQSRFINK